MTVHKCYKPQRIKAQLIKTLDNYYDFIQRTSKEQTYTSVQYNPNDWLLLLAQLPTLLSNKGNYIAENDCC